MNELHFGFGSKWERNLKNKDRMKVSKAQPAIAVLMLHFYCVCVFLWYYSKQEGGKLKIRIDQDSFMYWGSWIQLNMSCLMAKPTKWRCAQWRLISAFAVCSVGSSGPKLSSCGQQRLWSDGGWPGWSESSLGAHAILLVLSWGDLYVLSLHILFFWIYTTKARIHPLKMRF